MTDSNKKVKKIEQDKTEAGEKVVPAEQAARAAKQFKGVWGGLLREEKIMAIGALVSFIAFFLPWISVEFRDVDSISGVGAGRATGWAYLHPLLMLVSLGLVYFTQGASKAVKILMARWQIIIGTMFATIGLIGIVGFQSIIEALEGVWRFRGDIGIDIGIGWWLLTLGTIAILVGALMTQEKLVKK